MNPSDRDRWQIAKSLLNEAIALEPTEQIAFLKSRCGDDDSLFTELHSLLKHAAMSEARDFMREAATQPESLSMPAENLDTNRNSIVSCPVCRETVSNANYATTPVRCDSCGNIFRVNIVDDEIGPVDCASPRLIDHFELEKCIGVGGFGNVWRALDTKLQRYVAIKIPREGVIDDDSSNAFLNEARVTATLRHPNIVTVHDVGRVGTTVYVVSDLVDGLPLCDWPPRKTLSFGAIAKLFEVISRAIHYSHESGVIHRDLKPANVMMDDDGQPHIMDFGLAKRDAIDLTVTTDGRILGTPAYMSPEQARGELQKTDRRTDVYSLGVMLYEMLTDELPFRGSIPSIVHQVTHDPPPQPRRLNRAIHADLETICLKCLEKSPNHRYQSSLELADELARFQKKEPIHARPVSVIGKLTRWCQRNPLAASLVLAIAGLLFTGAIAGFVAASQQAALAAETHDVNQQLTTRNEELVAATELANKKTKEASNAVNDFFTEVSESEELLAGSPGTQALRKRLLQRAEQYYSRFVAENNSQENEAQLADVTGRLASIQEWLGDLEAAEQHYEESLQRYRTLLDRDPKSVDMQRAVARSYSNLATLQNVRSRFADAETNVLQSIALWKRLLDISADDIDRTGLAVAYDALGVTYQELGKVEDALAQGNLALQLYEQLDRANPTSKYRADVAASHYNQANGYLSSGKITKASESYTKAIQLFQTLTEESPDDFKLRELLARSHANMAIAEFSHGNLSKATTRFETAAQLYDNLKRDNPRVVDYGDSLAKTRQNLGMLYDRQGMRDEAVEQQHLEVDATENPEIVAMSLNNLGAMYYRQAEYDEAANIFRQMIEMLENVIVESPEEVDAKNKLAAAYNNLAGVYRATDTRLEEAIQSFQKSIRIRRSLVESSSLPIYSRGLAEALNNLAQLYATNNKSELAIELFVEAIEIWEGVCTAADVADHHSALGETLVNLARVYKESGSNRLAWESTRRAQESVARALKLDPDHAFAATIQINANELEAQTALTTQTPSKP